MTTTTHTTTEPASPGDPRTTRGFAAARRGIRGFGALGTLGLLAVVAVAAGGHPVTTFMAVRAVLLPGAAVLIHRMVVSASRGSRRAFARVRALTVLLPVAIIGVDLIPGVCPLWYAGMQAVCVLPVIRVAFVTRGAALRAAFRTAR